MILNGVEVDEEYLGQYLLEQGFEIWFRYMFRVIEQKDFIVEEIHNGLFEVFDDIYSQLQTRECINVPPRAGKTTLGKWFMAYAITINPKCNFIYTSFSQSLLADISRELMQILEHPIYKAMYNNRTSLEEEDTNPIDDFWREYLYTNENKNVYSTKKIVTREGGVLLFASIGSTITGFGAGIRSAKSFSGALIIDDANKPADIYSQLMRNKVLRYFEETLLSRLNNSDTAIINIQQRLHLEDLSGFLIDKYNFKTLKRPLIDSNGNCLIPKQYSPERIQELQANAYMFAAQYQQEPVQQGGTMIRSEWFKYYTDMPEFKRVFMTGDTAQKTKEANDFSVFCVWGQFNQELYLLDLVRGKWESPELLIKCEAVIKKWQKFKKRLSEIILEDKASGTGLIQTLRRTCLTPIKALQVDKDKVTRVDDSTPFLSNGYMYLPMGKEYGFNPVLINECELFARDMSHSHDDIVDNITMAIQYVSKKISIYDAI